LSSVDRPDDVCGDAVCFACKGRRLQPGRHARFHETWFHAHDPKAVHPVLVVETFEIVREPCLCRRREKARRGEIYSKLKTISETYADLIREYARQKGLRRWLIFVLGIIVGQWLAFGAMESPAGYHVRAQQAWEHRDYLGAMRLWSHAVSLQPGDPTFQYFRGTALAWGVLHWALDVRWGGSLVTLVWGIGASAALALGVGFLGTFRLLGKKPLAVLRSE
jgi:hypothetical protein